MVEPAIGITAAAIATLRPLFANFLTFTSKRFANDSESSFTATVSTKDRPSGDSRPRLSKGSGQEYSAEFAEMLGLEKFGVTTTVTARKPPTWREKRRAKREMQRLGEGKEGDSESQVELNYVKADEVPEWSISVQRTMSVQIDG